MKTSSSPLWQIPGYSMFFGFLVIFASGSLGQEPSPQPTKETNISESSTVLGSISVMSTSVPFPSTEVPNTTMTTKDTGSDVSLKAPPVSKVLVATSSNNEKKSISTLALEQHSTSKHLEPVTIPERKETATAKQTKLADNTTDVYTSTDPETTTAVASTLTETEKTKAVGKSPTAVGESTSSNTTEATVRSTYLLPRSRKGEQETSTPGQDDPTARDTGSRRPETQSTIGASTIKASEADIGVTDSPLKGSGAGTAKPTSNYTNVTPSPSKVSRGVTVAIVLSILLLLVFLVAILFCWRRRHSGSTSFKTAGWAGQADLLDDAGLDKELEQGALTAGEGATRRATLTTFFGKRQSRVPSVAMEEVDKKETGDGEEARPLIDGGASKVSGLEGSGESNGKLPEPAARCSQETEFPPPPANQEQTPPAQPE
uniref:leukosialin n=1 Tax=Euleptes europaea TaxID=460621 RepID=UPI00254222C5|nr:leukosialin [Euleptes europaea]